jgi:hypothetical protein
MRICPRFIERLPDLLTWAWPRYTVAETTEVLTTASFPPPAVAVT